jgi:hypothetical protein
VHGGHPASTLDFEHDHGHFEIGSEGEKDMAEDEESGEGAVLGTTVRTQAGLVPAILDTGAFSIWTTRAEIHRAGGKNFIPLSTTARSVDGSPVKVEGEGMMQFQLWGQVGHRKSADHEDPGGKGHHRTQIQEAEQRRSGRRYWERVHESGGWKGAHHVWRQYHPLGAFTERF